MLIKSLRREIIIKSVINILRKYSLQSIKLWIFFLVSVIPVFLGCVYFLSILGILSLETSHSDGKGLIVNEAGEVTDTFHIAFYDESLRILGYSIAKCKIECSYLPSYLPSEQKCSEASKEDCHRMDFLRVIFYVIIGIIIAIAWYWLVWLIGEKNSRKVTKSI